MYMCVRVHVCVRMCSCKTEREQSQDQGPQRCHDACPTPSCLLISFLQCDLPLSSRDLPHLCPKTGPQLSRRPGLPSPHQPSLTSSSTLPSFPFQQWPLHVPTSGPLHRLYLQPGMLFPKVSTWVIPSPPSGLYLKSPK